jgi:hypothetical protein
MIGRCLRLFGRPSGDASRWIPGSWGDCANGRTASSTRWPPPRSLSGYSVNVISRCRLRSRYQAKISSYIKTRRRKTVFRSRSRRCNPKFTWKCLRCIKLVICKGVLAQSLSVRLSFRRTWAGEQSVLPFLPSHTFLRFVSAANMNFILS